MIVVDTNVMVHLLVGGSGGPAAARLLQRDPAWASPGILLSELRNVLVGYVRRDVLTPDQVAAMCADAEDVLADRVVAVPSGEVLHAALEDELSAYDAEFVVAARRLGVPLVTLDREILRGAADVATALEDET